MTRFYQILADSWVEACVSRFGRTLPMNFIAEGAVGHKVDEQDDPLTLPGGEVIRVFRLNYDYGSAINERQTIN